MKKMLKVRLSLGAVVSVIWACACGVPVFAAPASTNYSNAVIQKTLLSGLYKCYNNDAVNGVVEYISSFKSFPDLVSSSVRVKLPTGLTPITNDAQDISCKALLAGDGGGNAIYSDGEWGTFEGLFNLAGKNGSANTKEGKIALLTGMGYADAGYTDTSTPDKCISFTYKETQTSPVRGNPRDIVTDNICAILDSSGKIESINIDKSTATYFAINTSGAYSVNTLPFFSVDSAGKIVFDRATTQQNLHGYVQKKTTLGIGDSWDDFLVNLKQTAASEPSSFSYTITYPGNSAGATYNYALDRANDDDSIGNENSAGDSRYEFAPVNRRDPFGTRAQKAGIAATNYLAVGTGPYTSFSNSFAFDQEERLEYFLLVLQNYYFEGQSRDEYWKCNVDWTNYSLNFDTTINAGFDNGVLKKGDCKLNSEYFAKDGSTSRKSKTFTAFYSENDKYYFGSTPADFDFLVRDINTIIDNLLVDDSDEIIGDITDEDAGMIEDPLTEAKSCINSGGAKSLGWIVCPVMEWMSDTASGMYKDAVAPMLQVDPVLFTDGVGSNTQKGWENFRNIANVLFIILFLAVIFSQLTGYGIDNYGIKKILPKLIVAAILINLSYFICQALIDLSNILGNSLQAMFDGFAQQPAASIKAIGAGDEAVNVSLANTGGIATVGVLTALVGGAVAIFMSPGLLLGLAISALGMVVSLFFLFILLGVREAAILVLTVISPIAVVCFILPNTKNLFNKWWKFFSSLLLVYPIAGLLVGGGNYVSVLLLSSGAATSFWLSFVAMIMSIVPIFFIPTALKGALNAAGQLGAKISGIGNSVKNGTVGRFAKSDARKRMTTGMNNFDPTGARDKLANTKFGAVVGLRNTRARQVAAARKQKDENLAAGALLTGSMNDRYEKKHGAIDKNDMQAQINEALESGDESKFYALMDDAGKRFGVSKSSQMFRKAVETGYGKGLMSDKRRTKFLRDSAARYGGFQDKDYTLGKYMQQGGAGMSLAAFEGDIENSSDIKDEQAASLNADSLARMMSPGGGITQEMAQRVMANKELRRGMDNTQQLMWANHAQGGASLSKKEAEAYSMGYSTYEDASGATQNVRTFDSSIIDMLKPLPEKVDVVGGSVGVSGGTITVDGGTLDSVGEIKIVHDVNQVRNVTDVQNVHTVDNVTRVNNIDSTVDVNIRDVNTKGSPQTQPLEVVTPKPKSEPPRILGPDGKPLT